MKECYLYKKLPDNKAQCQTCWHYCLIAPGKRGKCGVRENQKGSLYALNYGLPCALAIDPIEKKPLYHFLPQTETLSIAAMGCNLACWACQNWQISQAPKLEPKALSPASELSLKDKEISPQKIVDLALKYKTPSISYTYTEPTIFLEYALDIMKIAKKQGLKNILVSNGFMSPQTLKLMIPTWTPLTLI